MSYFEVPMSAVPEELKKLAEEVPPVILDSGDRTEFTTGAVRDMREGKGRCDLMPLRVLAKCWHYFGEGDELDEAEAIVFNYIADFQDTGNTEWLLKALNYFQGYKSWPDMFLEVAKHFEDGAKKYGESNWQKGIPVHCYIDSAVRHYLKWLRGDKDEPHDRAFVWNLMCCIWEVDYSPRSLAELAKGEDISDPDVLKEKAEEALHELRCEPNRDFIEMKINIHPYECRLGDYPYGLFEFDDDIYAKTSAESTDKYVIATRVADGARKVFNPDLVVGTVAITEVDYSPIAKGGESNV